jgi:hypothetical protein
VPALDHTTIRVVVGEHRALSVMLRSLSMLLAQARRQGGLPHLEAVRARLWWLDESPERLHHKKEGELLPDAASSSAADWAELDVAAAANRDPLTGHEPDSS